MSATNICYDDMAVLLYADEFCELTSRTLFIKRYFFPSLGTKIVCVNDVCIVNYEAQKNAKYARRRLWGMDARLCVHWAVDFSRCLPGDKHGKIDIVIDVKDGVRKGFTVRDANSFLNALRAVAPISLIIVDNLHL